MAFVVANAAVASDKETMVFLSTEGVRLGEQGYADDIHEEGFAPLRELMANFVKAGGKIWVCSPCFKQRKLDETQARRRRDDRRRREAGGVPRRRRALRHRTEAGDERDATAAADAVCDGGDLDCGSGLLLIIREAMAPLPRGRRARGAEPRDQRRARTCRRGAAWSGTRCSAMRRASGARTSYFVRKKARGRGARARPRSGARLHAGRRACAWTGGMQAQGVRAQPRLRRRPAGELRHRGRGARRAIEVLLGALGGVPRGRVPRGARRGAASRCANLEVALAARADEHPGASSASSGGRATPGSRASRARPTSTRTPTTQSLRDAVGRDRRAARRSRRRSLRGVPRRRSS